MTISAEFIIVGSGLTGSTVARLLTDAGREVLIVERRSHVGGNVHDQTHPASGIRFHTYGPHLFRTSSERIWNYATRFADFWPYEHRILSLIDGELIPWPVQREYIERLAGKDWKPPFTGTPRNFEEACLSMMPEVIYRKAVEPYNRKQWNKSGQELSPSLCKRFDVRDGETRLTPHAKHQGIPRAGYAAWMARMLDGIPVYTGFDYCQRRAEVRARKCLVFTGPIDEYFGFQLGRLDYRAQQREHTYHHQQGCIQPVAQVNNPQHENGRHIRDIEWKHLMPPREISPTLGTLLTRETPYSPTDPDAYEYPMPDEANGRRYNAYRELARQEERVVFGGRLGRYVYLDMDGAIGAAMKLADKLLGKPCSTSSAS